MFPFLLWPREEEGLADIQSRWEVDASMSKPAPRVFLCLHQPSAFRELIPAFTLLVPLLVLTWGHSAHVPSIFGIQEGVDG